MDKREINTNNKNGNNFQPWRKILILRDSSSAEVEAGTEAVQSRKANESGDEDTHNIGLEPDDDIQIISIDNKETFMLPKKNSTHNMIEKEVTRKSAHLAPISSEKIKQMKSYIDITKVIESYNLDMFTMTGIGKAKARCPFHDDHNPSLSVDSSKMIYKCFACGHGGDVFHFVRTYTNLMRSSKEEEMTFLESVYFVMNEFLDPNLIEELDLPHLSNNLMNNTRFANFTLSYNMSASTMPMKNNQEETELEKEKRKQRMLMVMAYAADYYGNYLLRNPKSGIARMHLRSLELSPETVHNFCFGYAPDCYFSSTSSPEITIPPESLVYYLKKSGFTAQEILESGLATQKSSKQIEWEESSKQHIFTGSTNDTDYEMLMDRFRNRLMIPILDAQGENIIGFGGRHLQRNQHDNNQVQPSFQPAKYINSPESIVFHKKDILFNYHMNPPKLHSAIESMPDNSTAVMAEQENNIILVEGYMDAISIYNSGTPIKAVASMGTSITAKQLDLLFTSFMKTDSNHSSTNYKYILQNIYLCLDADDAGQNATERLAYINKKSMLHEMELKYPSSNIYVCSLPATVNNTKVKDPAEFFLSIPTDTKANDDDDTTSARNNVFTSQVLKKAQPWKKWYLNRIINTSLISIQQSNNTPMANVNVTAKSQGVKKEKDARFTTTKNRIADFISIFQSHDDLSQLSLYAAQGLAAKMSNPTSSLILKLESDILNLSTRKFKMQKIAKLQDQQQKKKEYKYVSDNYYGNHQQQNPGNTRDKTNQTKAAITNSIQQQNQWQQFPNKRARSSLPPAVPHFAGINFKNPNDSFWMQSSSAMSSNNLFLGLDSYKQNDEYYNYDTDLLEDGHHTYDSMYTSKTFKGRRKFGRGGKTRKKDIVYFNSNDYLGINNQNRHNLKSSKPPTTKTSDSNSMSSSESQILTRISQYTRQDPDRIQKQAEIRLLTTLIQNKQARIAMKIALDYHSSDDDGEEENSDGDDPTDLFSRFEYQWLLKNIMKYVSNNENDDSSIRTIQEEESGMNKLYTFLLDKNDLPANAFEKNCSVSNDTEHQGLFDPFFIFNPPFLSPTYNPTSKSSQEQQLKNWDYEESIEAKENRQIKGEITVQETLAILLKVSTMKQKQKIQEEWVTQTKKLHHLLQQNNTDQIEELDMLKIKVDDLGKELNRLTNAVLELDTSAKRMSSRLLSLTMGLSSTPSSAKNPELPKLRSNNNDFSLPSERQLETFGRMLDEHLENLPQEARLPPKYDQTDKDDESKQRENYVFGNDSHSGMYNSQYGSGEFRENKLMSKSDHSDKNNKDEHSSTTEETDWYYDDMDYSEMSDFPTS